MRKMRPGKKSPAQGIEADVRNKGSVTGAILLALAAFVWGLSFVSQRSGMDHIGPFVFNSARMVLAAGAAAVMLTVKFGFREAFRFDRDTLKAGVVCGTFMTGGNLMQQMGLKFTSAGKAGFITALYIILVPVIRVIFMKKKETLRTWIGVAAGAVGLYLLCVSSSFTVAAGDLWVLGCALMFALQIIAVDAFVKDSDPLKICFIQFSVNVVLSLIPALIFEASSTTADGIREAGNAILYCGLISGAGGYILQTVGQKTTRPEAASMIMSLESVFAALAGWILLSETMSVREIAGCVIMFIAVMLI